MSRLDAYLRARPRFIQLLCVALTLAAMVWQCLPNVPREYVDYAHVPLLRNITQPATFGTDTIADMYEAKVILNDPLDMYTKRKLEQTPLEAETWSKSASAPYPPIVLLAESALYTIGQRIGVGFYAMVLLVAALFIGLSAYYFLQTRWYLFPLLYLNFAYFGQRFVAVQDGSYLIMLLVIMAALLLARAGRPLCHLLMAIAIDMKLSPLFYVTTVPHMRRRTAVTFLLIIVVGLALPSLIRENYRYIFLFHDELKGGPSGLISGLVIGAAFSLMLWYVETRTSADLEDRIGWALIPFGMFLAMKMNVPRHLLILLLVPDKRGVRNIIAAFALLVPLILPVRFGATLPIATVLLFGALWWRMRAIGWTTVRNDVRRPMQTLRLMCGI